VARRATLSVRRPRHLLPQIVAGRPADAAPGLGYLTGKGLGRGSFAPRIPRRLRRGALGRLPGAVSSPRLHGLPPPGGGPHEVGALPAPQLLERLLHGRVDVKPAIVRFDRDLAHFADGSAARVDLVVWCGACPYFPFLGPPSEPAVNPVLGVFAAADLAFLGLAEPIAGSPAALAELQARWVALGLAGEYVLPEEGVADGRSYSSPKLERVEQFEYAREVERELRAGRRRSRKRVG
jgi:hypothetical protein